jgi:hypothetical protein
VNKNVFCTKKCISSDHVEERLNGSAAIAASRDLCGMLYNLHERLHFPLIWRASDSKAERFFSLLFSQTTTLNNAIHVCRCLPTRYQWPPSLLGASPKSSEKFRRKVVQLVRISVLFRGPWSFNFVLFRYFSSKGRRFRDMVVLHRGHGRISVSGPSFNGYPCQVDRNLMRIFTFRMKPTPFNFDLIRNIPSPHLLCSSS